MADDSRLGLWVAIGSIGSLLAGVAAVVGIIVLRPSAPPQANPVEAPAPSSAAEEAQAAPQAQPGQAERRTVDTSPPAEFPIHGHWRGMISQPNAANHSRYELIVSIFIAPEERIAGEVDYPALNCGGVWVGEPGSASRDGPWRVEEIIQRNPSACVPDYLDLRLRADGGINVDIRANPTSEPFASGAIYRVR